MAHITGGGITDNLPRVLPHGHRRARSTRRPGRCRRSSAGCSERGRVPRDDMLRTFNMGIGLIIVAAPRSGASALIEELAARGGRRTRACIGEIVVAGDAATSVTYG